MGSNEILVPIDNALRQILEENFDAEFYQNENYDLDLPNSQLFEHFLTTGAYEGRSPNPFFDSSEYLAVHRDVLRSGINPFAHFILHGKAEGRYVSQAIRLKQRLALFGEESELDWIAHVGQLIDSDFYRAQLTALFPIFTALEMNYAVHYALIGWKLGLDPNPDFSTSSWMNDHPDLALLKIAPVFVHYVIGALQTDEPQEIPKQADETIHSHIAIQTEAAEPEPKFTETQAPAMPAAVSAGDNQLLSSGLFDAAYYLATYTDVKDANVDPLEHYVNAGWREGRNPSSNFSTNFYLSSYKEVASAGMDPLTHYLLKGRSLDYLTKPAGGWKIEVFEQSSLPQEKEKDYQRYNEKTLSAKQVKAALQSAGLFSKSRTPTKLIFAISHDSYSTVTGGTQIFIADEMTNARNRKYTHLHLAPAKSGLTIGSTNKSMEVLLTLNGKVTGIAEAAAIFSAMEELKTTEITISIHSLIGFGAGFLKALAPIAQMSKTVFWLHDYSLACDGYNLLRNDTVYCGGPNPASISCEVCVYGKERVKRISQIKAWLSKVKPFLASPSIAALDIINSIKTPLPFAKSLVLPHWSISAGRSRKRPPDSPIRIAFVGYAAPSKGWPLFDEIATAYSQSNDLKFYHFVKGGSSPNRHVKPINCAVSSTQRYATAELLKKNKIDVVMILSPWPETFSYVAAESLIAGCSIVCHEQSGNVQAMTKQFKQGIVFKDDQDLMASIKEKKFIKALRKSLKDPHFHDMQQNNGIFDVLPQIP